MIHTKERIIGPFQYYSSSDMYLYTIPAKIALTIGATQNNHNCTVAQSPTNNACKILRAGFK